MTPESWRECLVVPEFGTSPQADALPELKRRVRRGDRRGDQRIVGFVAAEVAEVASHVLGGELMGEQW